MAATKFLDAIARLPDCDGEDSDAVGAYTQVKLDNVSHLLGKGNEFVDTWVQLPRNRWPASWHVKFANCDSPPVCPLRRNLYGHKLAGLLWQKHEENIILSLGFEKLMEWECLYVNRSEKLFLSVYVDDLKMAGNKENLPGMWDKLMGKMTLEKPKRFENNQYLGQSQR